MSQRKSYSSLYTVKFLIVEHIRIILAPEGTTYQNGKNYMVVKGLFNWNGT